jgi:hypothetical protein
LTLEEEQGWHEFTMVRTTRLEELKEAEIAKDMLLKSIQFGCEKVGGDCWTVDDIVQEVMRLRGRLESRD